MDFKIKISSTAKTHVKQAVEYYKNNASLTVAQNFIQDYENTLERIKQTPFFQIYYKNFRGLPLKKYPYIIFFQVNENDKLILITAVFQANQNPNKRP